MQRKGQAAMEFLMTYGWAILAAIVVIAVLAIYFRPSTLVSEGVILSAPLYGQGATVSPIQVQMEIKNNGGETITTTAGTLKINTPAANGCDAAIDVGSLSAGGTQTLSFNNCNFTSGSTVNADVTITYRRTGSTLDLQSTGSLTGKA